MGDRCEIESYFESWIAEKALDFQAAHSEVSKFSDELGSDML